MYSMILEQAICLLFGELNEKIINGVFLGSFHCIKQFSLHSSTQKKRTILIQSKPSNYEDYRVLGSLIDWAYTLPIMDSDTKKKVVIYDFCTECL